MSKIYLPYYFSQSSSQNVVGQRFWLSSYNYSTLAFWFCLLVFYVRLVHFSVRRSLPLIPIRMVGGFGSTTIKLTYCNEVWVAASSKTELLQYLNVLILFQILAHFCLCLCIEISFTTISWNWSLRKFVFSILKYYIGWMRSWLPETTSPCKPSVHRPEIWTFKGQPFNAHTTQKPPFLFARFVIADSDQKGRQVNGEVGRNEERILMKSFPDAVRFRKLSCGAQMSAHSPNVSSDMVVRQAIRILTGSNRYTIVGGSARAESNVGRCS